MTISIPTTGPVISLDVFFSTTLRSTMRTSWMANNAIPDSIIMNMIFRSFLPPVELNEPNVEVDLNLKNTLRILNTIKPVARAFTAMDVTKAVKPNVFVQEAVGASPNSQVAIDDRLRLLAYEMKINLLTYVCDRQ
jgi:hypothetical protein